MESVLRQLRSELPEGVTLVAVSKYHPADMIRRAYDFGQRVFGESHVQELQSKHAELPDDIEWHFIGHLQTNKVKYIAPYVSLIHSVDSVRLLQEISRQGVKCGRRIRCLLQLHVAQEETKFGFSPEECLQYLRSLEWKSLEGVELCGVMCMASNTDDEGRVVSDFEAARSFFRESLKLVPELGERFAICSWGMSGDYRLAVEHGSNMVRVGSMIFGERVY